MIYELRTYKLAVGVLPRFLELVEKERLPLLADHGLVPLGFWSTEIGNVNEVVHLWAHDSLDQRQERWSSDARDPRTAEFMPKIRPMILEMRTKILAPTSFSPMK